MADEKLNTGPAENISPEAAEPIITPEQAAASEPQQEQTGPAIPESGDVVVSFDKINELIAFVGKRIPQTGGQKVNGQATNYAPSCS